MADKYTPAERRRRTIELVEDFERFKRERAELQQFGDYRTFMSGRGYDATCWEVAIAALRAAGVFK